MSRADVLDVSELKIGESIVVVAESGSTTKGALVDADGAVLSVRVDRGSRVVTIPIHTIA
ncbi:MAG: hypothetical protein H0U52_13385 [Chloroflexi bacterium]|nr:hypothetical protein [Chloroflexota bacterium]